MILALPQVVIISLIHGFIVDGGVTQYPLALAATLSVYSGPGLKKLYERPGVRVSQKIGFVTLMAAVIAAQFVALNAVGTLVSRHKNIGIYALGYSDDSKVISILDHEARGEFIHGIWGAFVEGRKKWDWTDYFVEEAIDKDPDWLVTFDNYVEIKDGGRPENGFKVYRVGPYVMIHSKHVYPMNRFVSARMFPRWKSRPGDK